MTEQNEPLTQFKPVTCPPGCVYAMKLHNGPGGEKVLHCGYVLYMDRVRGCDPGPGCIRYQRGKKHGPVGLRTGPKYTWDEPRGKKMWLEGKSDREIADALGVKRDTIGDTRRRKWMKETGALPR